MNLTKYLADQIKVGLLIGLLASTGCATYGGGPYYNGGVVVAEPDEYLFGGDYYGGGDARNYSHRGAESRGAAHANGGGHAGGGGHANDRGGDRR